MRVVNRPLLPLAPLAPAVAIILLAAASAAAESIAGARNVLEDVQIGEEGRLLRIAIVCKQDCAIGARAGGVFFLPGVQETIDVDLTDRSRLARALAFRPVNGGSAITVRADAPIARASIKPCKANDQFASCIDLEFVDAPWVATMGPVRLSSDEAAKREDARPQNDIPAPIPAGAAPPMREAPGEALLTFASLAPPERLTPPINARAVKKPDAPSRRPVILADRAAQFFAGDIDIAKMADAILGKTLGAGDCVGAEARLQTNAWALEAMVDVGFCKAAAGDLENADGVFRRLLDYTPDNYEALVGRALIAAKAGEKSVARKYFQDALNALPPIAESDRIVEAMSRL